MMIILLILTQILLPLALILWLAIAPLRNLLGVSLQILVTVITLFAIARMGVGIFPPWWTIYLYGLLFALALVTVLRRVKSLGKFPSHWLGWITIIVLTAFGVFTSNEAVQSWVGQFPPPIPAVNLTFPLRDGNYLIVNGGSNIQINAHLKLLDKSVPRFQAYRGSAYGIDIIKIDSIGLRANGLSPSNPTAYRIYGEPVLAPCSGEIVKAVDGLPDMTIPQIDAVNRAGNHVILRCGDVDVLLAHFRPQSLSVQKGTIVKIGDRIAEAGNSGTSDEPHLHIHAQRLGTKDQPFSGDPLPMKFEGRFLIRGDRITS